MNITKPRDPGPRDRLGRAKPTRPRSLLGGCEEAPCQTLRGELQLTGLEAGCGEPWRPADVGRPWRTAVVGVANEPGKGSKKKWMDGGWTLEVSQMGS